MEQQQLALDYQPSMYSVHFYKNDVLLAHTQPKAQVAAAAERRALVRALQRSPRCFTAWEDDPRSTGWFGLNQGRRSAAVYHITLERN
jgi:hypothetical protein